MSCGGSRRQARFRGFQVGGAGAVVEKGGGRGVTEPG